MKRFSLLSMISIIALSVFSISCSKDDDDVIPESKTVTDGVVTDSSATGDNDSTGNNNTDPDSTNNNNNDPDSTNNNITGPDVQFVGASEVNVTTRIGNDPISFMIVTSKGSVNLDKITFRINAAALAEGRVSIESSNDVTTLDDVSSSYTVPNEDVAGAVYTVSIEPNSVVGVESIQIAVIDDNGLVSGLTVTLTTEEKISTDLNTAENFTFMRTGGDDAVGLDQFGLSWTSNNISGMAVIKPNTGVTLVQLEDEASSNITTVEDLSEAIDNGTAISEYTGVSSVMNDTYTDVLGVKNNGVYYLIKIIDSSSEFSNSGAVITINGWSRSSL